MGKQKVLGNALRTVQISKSTILHDEVHASVQAEKVKTFWLCCKNKFLSSIPYLNHAVITADSAIQ